MKYIKFFIVTAIIAFSIQFAKASSLSTSASPGLLKAEVSPAGAMPPQHHYRHHRYRHHYHHGHYGRRGVSIHLPGPPPPPPAPPRP